MVVLFVHQHIPARFGKVCHPLLHQAVAFQQLVLQRVDHHEGSRDLSEHGKLSHAVVDVDLPVGAYLSLLFRHLPGGGENVGVTVGDLGQRFQIVEAEFFLFCQRIVPAHSRQIDKFADVAGEQNPVRS